MAIILPSKTETLPSMEVVRECITIAGKNQDALAYVDDCFGRILEANEMADQFSTLRKELFEPPKPPVTQAVEMDIVMGEAGHVSRGYLVDNADPVDDAQVETLDSAFHELLRGNRMLSRGGRIVEADPDGTEKTNAAGEMVPVDPAVLKSKLLDPVTGLKPLFDEQLQGFELKTLNVETAVPTLDVDEQPQPE